MNILGYWNGSHAKRFVLAQWSVIQSVSLTTIPVTQSKVRGAALVEQDKLVTEKDSKVVELTEQVQQMATKLSQLTLDKERLQSEHREAKEKLLEHEKTLDTNEKGWG